MKRREYLSIFKIKICQNYLSPTIHFVSYLVLPTRYLEPCNVIVTSFKMSWLKRKKEIQTSCRLNNVEQRGVSLVKKEHGLRNPKLKSVNPKEK